MAQWVYTFGDGHADGTADMRQLLGGKGANLAEMASLGLPVPAGFTISTALCTYFYNHDRQYPDDLTPQVEQAIAHIERSLGAKFGDPENPLLVSVRSGAPLSMPGMMDTVLNLGLNDTTVEGLAQKTGDPRFAYDSYRRFLQMYGDVVLGVEQSLFEEALDEAKRHAGVSQDTELDVASLERLVGTYKEIVKREINQPFPETAMEQLWGSVGAVFGSWMTPRAITYRRLHDIPQSMGTAVNVQAMVFGNLGPTSATGVAFTRNPSTGEKAYYGEYLINAQGEDVVAGIRTPQPLTKSMGDHGGVAGRSLQEQMPRAYDELAGVFDRLEQHYKDMQDIEFTVQQDKLYILQTRTGKRTAVAALKIAVDMVDEGLLSSDQAVLRIDPASLDQLLHPTLDPSASRNILTRGLPASPGAVSGKVCFDADAAERRAAAGEDVILARTETSPDDIHGMHAAKGILTARGGMTSHAAVVARGMGKPCVCGAADLEVREREKMLRVGSVELGEGDVVTIDGGDGTVMSGRVPTIDPELGGDFKRLMEWADAARRLKVRTNSETPEDTRTAVKFGAEGIGLCRTEHMFFEDGRILAMREMILATDSDGRRAALAKILPMQRGDFVEIFEIMAGLPVTIRLLDPPLHEFLPHSDEEMERVAAATDVPVARVRRRTTELREANPMLGMRGCRLGVVFPEIYEMQSRAIFEAAYEVQERSGDTVVPEVMVPLVGSEGELAFIKEHIDAVGAKVAEERGKPLTYLVGTMIEVPRAAIRADAIAEHAAFFSFGTNDLTQMTLGLSRDDSGGFMDTYLREEIYAADPFQTLDQHGVGRMIEIACDGG
ncbi:MAG: pyruvate, phosphate dikinase, partial [Alphaproteobacteria bacterium]|nr:pyruvate, phosphate dikinase [Alphaproteobacteria bacterium]